MGRDSDETGSETQRSVDPALAEEVSTSVMKRLREEYDALVAQPVPERFKGLLAQLDRVETKKGRSDERPGVDPEPHANQTSHEQTSGGDNDE